jgi:DNA topoisomerase II
MKSIPIARFMNSAFKEFSLYDNVRSIPSITDGFKNSQRKAVYGMLIRGENASELQIERLAAQIAAATDYHHGTGSMEGTLVGLANDFTGSNNMNLLVPAGQFGSRLSKESASGRYIFTSMHKNFRKLFKKEDDLILEHHMSNGEKIEPIQFVPILPMPLINGAQGTGTGHACVILNYNPEDIKQAVLDTIAGKKIKPMIPWYRGFTGTIQRNEAQTVITGKLEVVNTTTIKITELPVGVFLDSYKATLDKLIDNGFIKDYEDSSTEAGFDFVVNCPRSTTMLDEAVLLQKFKLISRDTENFTLWNTDGVLHKYSGPEEIIEEFVEWRLGKYEVRRQKLISITKDEVSWLSEKIRFINFYLANHEKFRNVPKKELIELLLANKFDRYQELLSMPIWNLTREKIEELEKELADKNAYLVTLEADTAQKMYARELKDFKYEE